MLNENSSHEPRLPLSHLKIALAVEGFQTVIYELLALLTELTQTEPHLTYTEYLAQIDSILHLMTDLETQLVIARTALKS
ncbi:MAG: hypothetical protein ACFFC7_34015, partial [Candidatus Hermodarchaeota archaeon]